MNLSPEHLRGGFAFEASTPDGYRYGVLATPEDLIALTRPLYMVVKERKGTREWCRWANSIPHGRSIIERLVEAHRAFDRVPPERRAHTTNRGHTGRGGE